MGLDKKMIFVVMVQRGKVFSTDVAFTTQVAANEYINRMNRRVYPEPDGFRYLNKLFLEDKKY